VNTVGYGRKDQSMGLWGVLKLASLWQIKEIMITGDSKVILDWFEGRNNLNTLSLSLWKNKVLELKNIFSTISSFHIHRVFNKEADRLSKMAIHDEIGRLNFREFRQKVLTSNGSVRVF